MPGRLHEVDDGLAGVAEDVLNADSLQVTRQQRRG
jgi:hypothetical protein